MTRSIKQLTTLAVIKQLGDEGVWTYEQAIKKWWMVPRLTGDGGLRLTEQGDLAFRYAKIEYYEYHFDIKIDAGWHNFLIDLNKKINCPYFLGSSVSQINNTDRKTINPAIRLYDDKIAMLIELYGSLSSYLKSIKVPNDRRKEK